MEKEQKNKVGILLVIIWVVIIVLIIIACLILYQNLSLDNISNSKQNIEQETKTQDEDKNNLIPGQFIIDIPNIPEEPDNEVENNLNSENYIADTPSTIPEEQNTKSETTKMYRLVANNKVLEIRANIEIDKEYQSEKYKTLQANDLKEQKAELSVEINGKKVELEQSTFYPTMGINYELKVSDIVQEVSTIKGQDNQKYIILVIVEKDYYTHDRQKCYVVDENAEVLGVFDYRLGASVIVEDYTGEFLKVNEDSIIEYVINHEEDEEKLEKWKYTIKDGKLEKELEKQYSKDEFSGAGARW